MGSSIKTTLEAWWAALCVSPWPQSTLGLDHPRLFLTRRGWLCPLVSKALVMRIRRAEIPASPCFFPVVDSMSPCI